MVNENSDATCHFSVIWRISRFNLDGHQGVVARKARAGESSLENHKE
jgi:hypothetical protein